MGNSCGLLEIEKFRWALWDWSLLLNEIIVMMKGKQGKSGKGGKGGKGKKGC